MEMHTEVHRTVSHGHMSLCWRNITVIVARGDIIMYYYVLNNNPIS